MKEIESKINGLQEEFICDKCKHKQMVNIYPYIDFKENPEFYSLVKDLKIFTISCNNCHTKSTIMYNILILDQTHKYFLYLLTNKDDLKYFKNQVNYFMEKNFNKEKFPDIDEYKFRIVYNLNELIEKMAIFELSLDDRVMEILKQAIKDDKIIEQKNIQLYFDGIEETDLKFIYLVKLTKEIKSVNLSISLYNQLIDKVKTLKKEKDIEFSIIDNEWALNLIKNLKENNK